MKEVVPTNLVPAVAARRGGQVLFIVIGRKEYVDGWNNSCHNTYSATVVVQEHHLTTSMGGVTCGTFGVEVKNVDFKGTTNGGSS